MHKDMLHQVKLICIFLILPFTLAFANQPVNFNNAKLIALELFDQHRVSLYCGCTYDHEKNVDLTSCNMNPATPIERAHRIEWEHMMPAEHFGRSHACWTDNLCHDDNTGKDYRGRRCCEKIDAEFRIKEAELYNLWPAVGLVNQYRSNYNFGVIENKRGFYGCEIEIDRDNRLVEPPDRAKGVVARANLFMSDKYKVPLSKEQRALYLRWSSQFPPTLWELNWAAQVANIVGYTNPYIKVRPLTEEQQTTV